MDVIGKLGGLIGQAEQKAAGIVEKYLPPPVAGSHLTPQALLKINGREFGTETQSRILGISLTDKRGFEADELTIELSDHDGALAIPDIGDKIQLWLGFKESGLVYKGEYLFAEFTHSGSPDTLSITARAADLAETLAEQKEKSWHKTTLYEIVETVAKTHGYPYSISAGYKNEKIAHIDQTNESDAAFLTRLAEQYDAVATVKNGRLLFIRTGQAETAGGQPIEEQPITRASGDGHSFTYSAANAYAAVRACYTDKKTGQKKEVLVNEENLYPEKVKVAQTKPYKRPRKDKATGKTVTGKTTVKTVEKKKNIDMAGKKVKTLRHLYATEAAALAGARAAFARIRRGLAEFSISLATGRPDLYPETPVTVQGFKAEIDAESWLIVEVAHRLGDSGYTCSLKLEARLQEERAGEEKEDKGKNAQT